MVDSHLPPPRAQHSSRGMAVGEVTLLKSTLTLSLCPRAMKVASSVGGHGVLIIRRHQRSGECPIGAVASAPAIGVASSDRRVPHDNLNSPPATL
jgi:hypothetical protein